MNFIAILKENKSLKLIGIILFFISCILWLFTFVVIPLLPLDTCRKVLLGSFIYAFREVAFYLSLYILGKPYINKIFKKNIFLKRVKIYIKKVHRDFLKKNKNGRQS